MLLVTRTGLSLMCLRAIAPYRKAKHLRKASILCIYTLTVKSLVAGIRFELVISGCLPTTVRRYEPSGLILAPPPRLGFLLGN